MKALPPTTQLEGIVAAVGHQSLSDREQPPTEDFDSALTRQKAEREPKLKSVPRQVSDQRHDQDQVSDRSGSYHRTHEHPLRSGGKLLHSLKKMAQTEPNDTLREVREEAPSKGQLQSTLSDLLPEHLAEKGAVAAIAAQLLGASASINHGSAEFQGQSGPKTGQSAHRRVDAPVAMPLLDPDGSLGTSIADTPIAVREQQTHFAPEPVGRSGVPPNGNEHDRSIAVPPRGALARGPAQSQDRIIEATQIELGRAERDVGQVPDDPAEASAPATQILGKIVDACKEESAPAPKAMPSAALQSTERPFGPLMRLIRIELSPASLGIVHVTLKGVNAALSVSIEAERSQTAAALGADRSLLSARLTEAGYAIDELVITIGERSLDVTAPAGPDQTSGFSNSSLAGSSDDSQRRQAAESWRRARPDHDRLPRSPSHDPAQDSPTSGLDLKISAPPPWRGRHVTRSV